jgi:excisionase family DNA binding protein
MLDTAKSSALAITTEVERLELAQSLGGVTHPNNSQPTRETTPLPTLVDIEAVSRSLGISIRQVRRFVATGQIPFVRIGNLIRFDPNELNEWIDKRRAGSFKST